MTISSDICCLVLLNVELAAAERRQDLRPLQRGQRHCSFEFPPPTGVHMPPALHESSLSHRTTKAVL